MQASKTPSLLKHAVTYGQEQSHSRTTKYRIPRDLVREVIGTVPDRGRERRRFCLELCCGPHQGLRRHARRRGWIYVGLDHSAGVTYSADADLRHGLPSYVLRADLSAVTVVELLRALHALLGLRSEDLCMVWVRVLCLLSSLSCYSLSLVCLGFSALYYLQLLAVR